MADIREAAAVYRGIHAACARPDKLPSTHVMRYVALHVRADLPQALKTRDVGRFTAAKLTRAHAASFFAAFPAPDDAARLDTAIKLLRLRLPVKHVARALELWSTAAPDRVGRDPYGCMWELKATLDEADALAAAAMTPKGRIACHAKWLLRAAKKEGHTMLPLTFLLPKLLARGQREVQGLTAAGVLQCIAEDDDLVCVGEGEGRGVADVDIARDEAFVAKEVRKRLGRSFLEPVDVDPALTEEQRLACKVVFDSSISIITGPPGTGKTTVVRALVEALGPDVCVLTAPTGRAARNVGGATIHSTSGGQLLRRPIQETTKADIPEGAKLLVADESSMLTTELMTGLLNLAPPTCHVVLVGDADQLAPVGCGNVFKDLLHHVPVAELTHNHRCSTAIQRLAHAVMRGGDPLEGEGVRLVEVATSAEGVRAVVDLCAAEPSRQVLVPHNAFRHTLNRALQSCQRAVPVECVDPEQWGFPRGAKGTLSTAADGASTLVFGAKSLTLPVDQALTITRPLEPILPNDLVMVLKNQNKKQLRPGEASACNGDVGVLVRAHPKAIVKLFGKTTEFPGVDGWLTLAYAATVHKFQGSECDRVVIPVFNAVMWDRHLLYTAVTRARAEVVLVGSWASVKAISQRVRADRNSALSTFFLS